MSTTAHTLNHGHAAHAADHGHDHEHHHDTGENWPES